MDISYIILAIIIALILFIIFIYNKLIKRKQMVDEGWSGIDVQLKRRSNLIPNLVETVKGYMEHESDVLENVTEMRARVDQTQDGDITQRSAAESMLSGALANLFAVAENYPDLKASDNFTDLHNSLSEVEEQIQLARRYYNGAVRDMNILVESFPSNLVAKQFRFVTAVYFELANEDDREVPEVDFKDE